MLHGLLRWLRPQNTPNTLHWMNRNLAIGLPAPMGGWRTIRARGVRAVVDLSQECGSVGGMVREHGMRYLRLSVNGGRVPEAEELHIVTSWVQQRIREDGPVLVHDSSVRGNDAVVACAVLIKEGRSVEWALSKVRGISEVPLSQSQVGLLHQFMAQRFVSAGGS